MAGTNGPALLVVQNGDGEGGGEVATASVAINGATLVQLSAGTRLSAARVTLSGQDTVSASATGTGAVRITVAPEASLPCPLATLSANGTQTFGWPDAHALGILKMDYSGLNLTGEVTFNGVTVYAGLFPQSFLSAIPLQASNTLTVGGLGVLNTVHAVVFDADSLPPSVAISAPADGVVVSSSPREVTGTTSLDATGVSVAGVAPTRSGTGFTASVSLVEGENPVTVEARDACGNVARVCRPLILDTVPPALALSGVTEGMVTQGPVTPTWTAEDLHLAASSATLNGVPFASGTAITAEGEYDLVVTAVDQGGLTTSVERHFSILLQPPAITIGGVADGEFSRTDVSPTFSAQSPHLDQVTATLNGAPFTSGTTLSAEDAYHLVVTARDVAGNQAQVELRFTLDKTPPVVTFSGVPPGSFQKAAVAVGYAATDANLLSVGALLDGSEVLVSGGLVSTEGAHTVVATAVDRAGNSASASLSFTLDFTAPAISVAGVTEGQIGKEPVTPAFSATDLALAQVTATLDGAPFSSGHEVTAEGEHLLHVQASDSAGNVAQQEVHFTIDRTAPVISIAGVTEGAVQAPPVAVTFSATDAHLPVATATLDGSAFSSGDTIDQEGPHTLVVQATDAAGNAASRTLHFELDGTAPAIAITGVSEGQLSNGPVTPVIAVTDAHPGQTVITLDGQPFSSGSAVTAEGAHTLSVLATDLAGNQAQQQRSFTLDLTPPTVSIAGVSDGERRNQPATVTFSAEDAHGVTLEATLNGQPFTSGGTVTSEGDYTLSVTATDGAGNVATVQRAFVIDTTSPVLAVIAPADGLVTSAASVELVVSAQDAGPIAQVEVGGVALTATGGQFHGTLPLVEGSNLLTVAALDAAGNSSTLQLTVTRDSQAPVLTVTSPAEGALLEGTSVHVTGSVTDATAVTLTVNGAPVTLGVEGAFDATVPVQPGDNAISLTATDAAGNTSAHTLTIHINTTPPTLTVTEPVEGLSFSGPFLTVRGVAQASVAGDSVRVTVDGAPVVVNAAGEFSHTVQLEVGSHTLEIVATDGYGLSTTQARSVTREGTPSEDAGAPSGGEDGGASSGGFDAGTVENQLDAGTLAPVLVLDAPADGVVVGHGSVAVSGAIQQGRSPFTVAINGSSVAVNGTTFAAAVSLPEGTHAVQVQVTDAEQRTASLTRTVIVDQTAPFLEVTHPSTSPAQVNQSPYTLAGTVSDPNLASVTVNGAQALVLAGGFSHPVALQAGSNLFHIEARDLAGNVRAVDQVVEISAVPPDVAILAPLAGTEAKDPVIEVKAQVTAPAGISSVQIGTGPATESSPGIYSAQVPLSLGDNVISVAATDTQGLTGSASVTVHYRDAAQEPLVVTGVDPAAGATGVGTESLVSVAFNKPVKPETLAGHFQVLAGGAPFNGGYAIAPGGQTAIFVARSPLPDGATIRVQVEGVEPTQGPPMSTAFGSSFTVRQPLVAIHGQVMDATLAPLAGVRVQVEGTDAETRTGADGTWALIGVPGGGSQVLRFTGGSTSDGRSLPTVRRALYVNAAGQTSDRPLFLVPVNGASAQRMDGALGGTLDFAGTNGALALGVPAGGLAFSDGTTAGYVTATEVPAYARPVPLFDAISPTALWQVGPQGLQVLKPLAVTFPNRTALPAGRMVVVLGFDPDRLALQRVALGHVSADGSRIEADAPVQLTSLDLLGYMALSQAEQDRVEAALASLASQGTPDGGLGLRGFAPAPGFSPRSGWERVLSAVLPAAHAQFGYDPFSFGMAALDSQQPGISTVFGAVRAPRANELKEEVSAPALDALPQDAQVSLPYTLPVSFTAKYVSNDPVVSGGAPPLAVTLEVHAVGSDGKVVSAPAGQSWTTTGSAGEASLSSTVPLTVGTTQVELTALAGASSRTVRLNAVVTPAGDGGTQSGRLSLTQLADPSDEVDPLGGSAYFSGIRVDLTSETDSVALTGASGSYSTVLQVPGQNTMGISCAQLPLGSRSVAYLKGGSTLFTKVDPDFYACSPTYSVDPGSSMRADVLVDVRYLTGKLQFRNRDGTPVPVLCEGDEAPTSWSAGGAALSHLSAQDVGTTEVHFFREGHLDTPIAKYTVAEPTALDCTDGVPGEGTQAKYARVWVGPANPSSSATRTKCQQLKAKTAPTPEEVAYLNTQCSQDGSSFTRLSPGDRVVVFALNHATGFAGEATVTVPPIERQPSAADGGCPADDEAGGPLVIHQGGETVTLSRCAQEDVTLPADVDLYPPELDVTVERAAQDEGVTSSAQAHWVRTGGAGTTRDDYIEVSTDWRVRLAPAGTSAAGGDGGTEAGPAPASELCANGKLLDGGDCLPDVLVDAAYDAEGNALDAGARLEVFCSELPPTANADARAECLKDGRELAEVPEGIPPLAGQVISVTGTAVEQPAVAVFPVRPGHATANVQASLRRVDANGEHETLNNLKRANYYVHVVGNRLLGRDTDGDGFVSEQENDAKPPDFSQTLDGGLPGMPDQALWLKAVYRHLEGGATPVARYDRAKEHEFRVVELTPKEVTAETSAGDRDLLHPDGGTPPAATENDLEYQFLAGILDDGPSRAGTLTGDYEVRLGSDDYGIDCPVHLDETSHTLTASCDSGYLPDVLSASDLLYLEVYLSGNAENVLYRFNFNGLAPRTDLVSVNTAYTADVAIAPDTDGTPEVGRPISIPPLANFYVDPAQLTAGTLKLCSAKDCGPGSLLKEALLTLGPEGEYQVTETAAGSVKAHFNLSPKLGVGGAQLFRLDLPTELAEMRGTSSVGKPVFLQLLPSDGKAAPPIIPLGTPKGGFDGRNAASPGHASREGIDVADGHLSFTHTDFTLPFKAGAVSFARTYNNQDNTLRPLGVGWTDGFDGWVVEERVGRYAVVLNGQAYAFPICTLPSDPTQYGSATACTTDKSHGMTLTVDAPLKTPPGETPQDHLVVTTPDGWEYDFDKPASQRIEGRRKWMLTRFADSHRENNDDAWMELSYGLGERVERVERHDHAVRLDFTYEHIDQQDEDIPEGIRTLARRGFAWLSRVDVSVADATPYSVYFEHDLFGNLTRVATDGGKAPYRAWKYEYLPVPEALSAEEKRAVVNELSQAERLETSALDTDEGVQWRATYERANEAPYSHLLPFEVVSSIQETGMQGAALQMSYNGTSSRTVTHPDGVTESIGLNEYGNPKQTTLPLGHASSSWGSETRAGVVFPESRTSLAGYGIAMKPTDRLVTQEVDLGVSPDGAAPVDGLSQGDAVFSATIDPNLGVATSVSVASATDPIPISTPRTPAGDLLGITVGTGMDARSVLSNLSHDADGVLLSATDAQGRHWVFSDFDALGQPKQAQATLTLPPEATGLDTLTRTMAYDAQGRLLSVSEAETGAFESWSYDGLGRVTHHMVSGTPAEDWTYSYQAGTLQLTVTESLAKAEEVETDATNARPAWTKTTTYTENAVAEAFKAGNPAQDVTRTTHLAHGRPESMTDELGHVWTYGYDANGHLTSTSVDGNTARTRTLDADGRVLSETDGLGATTTHAYDALARTTKVDFGGGDVISAQLDGRGATTHQAFNDDAHPVQYTADAQGLPATATSEHPNGGVSMKTTWDAAGRKVRFEDVTRGLVETFAYGDVLGRLTQYTRQMTSGNQQLHLTETRSYDDTTHTVSVTRAIDTGLTAPSATRTETETAVTDVRGRVLSETREVDGAQATTSFAYNERGQPWKTTSPMGEVTQRFYDVQGQLAETVDTEGYKTEYQRDGLEQLSAETGPHPGRAVTYTYDALGRMLSKTVAAYGSTPAMTWDYAYPGSGQVVETAGLTAGDIVTTRTMNGRGRLMSEVVASQGHQRTRDVVFDGPWKASEVTKEDDWQLSLATEHDDLGRLSSSEESWEGGGQGYDYKSSTIWDGLGADVTWTDEAGGKSQTYTASLVTDSLDNLVSRTQAGVADAWLYDAAGKLSQQTPGGRPPTVASYVNGLLKTSTYGVGLQSEVTTYGYDLDGRTASVLTPDGRTRSYVYWPRGLVKEETYGTSSESTSTHYEYDALGDVATRTEGFGTPDEKTWTYGYGPRGEIQSATQPNGSAPFEYGHDGLLRLTKVTPPSGSPSPETTYGYDYLGRETRKVRGASVWATTWGGGAGATTSPMGDVVTRLYDGRGRLADEAYQPGAASAAQTDITHVVRRYTGSDGPWETVETHQAGQVTNEYGYDGRRRLTQVARGADIVTYAYRDSGERESVTSPLGTASYGYDALERLSSVTGPAGETQVEWEVGGQRLLALRDETLKERHCYDGRGWLTAVVNATSDVACNGLEGATGLQSRFVYGYDGRGNRLSQEYLDGSLSTPEVTEYGYSGADWLTGVKYPDGHAALYQLAGDGTRTGEREVSGYAGGLGPDGFAAATNPTKDWTYGFDSQGGLKTATQPQVLPGGGVTQVEVASWTTDGAGRVTRSVTPEGTRTFAWSARDTLGQAMFTPAIAGGDGTSVTVSYGYDGDGLRRSRAVNGSSTGYLWAAGQLLEERLPGNAILYANAAGMSVSAGADRLAHDGLGSVVGLVGIGVTTRKYDAWGAFVGGTALTSVQPSVAYAGQAFDADLGLSYAQQRWYDSATGRFLSTDPIGMTSHRLLSPAGLAAWPYASANSLRYVDPKGLCTEGTDEGCELGFTGLWRAAWNSSFTDETYREAVARIEEENSQKLQTNGPSLADRADAQFRRGVGWVSERLEEGEEWAFSHIPGASSARARVKDAAESVDDVFDRSAEEAFVRMSGAEARANAQPNNFVAQDALNEARKNARGTGKAIRQGVTYSVQAAAILFGPGLAGDASGDAIVDDEIADALASQSKAATKVIDVGDATAHKVARWQEYQARNGAWDYERWSNVYDQNMVRATLANKAADAYHAAIGWGKREVTVDVEGVPRRLDIADQATLRGVEVKSGYQTATQENLWELQRDQILQGQGWDIRWHFVGKASKQLREALQTAGIPYTGGAE